jgi:hypothetical protein
MLREYRDPWSGAVRRHKPRRSESVRPATAYDALYSALMLASRNASQALISGYRPPGAEAKSG